MKQNNPEANEETGEIFLNLSYINNNEELREVALHEATHTDSKYNKLSHKNEEKYVTQNSNEQNSLIDYYYNTGSKTTSLDSKLTSFALSHSGFSNIYTQNQNHLGNLYQSSTKNLTQNSLITNNRVAREVDRGKIETWLMPEEKKHLVEELKSCNGNNSCENKIQQKYEKISEPRDKEFVKAYESCKDGNCSEFNKIHYDLRGELTEKGNDYWNSLTPEQRAKEFKLLPPDASIFHTYQQDSNGKVINVKTGEEKGYTKYVHPIYGYEVVLDKNKNIVTNPLNIGTYNFYNPKLGVNNTLIEDRFGGKIGGLMGNHKKFDVDPYYPLGNSSGDPSTKEQRNDRNIYYFRQLIN